MVHPCCVKMPLSPGTLFCGAWITMMCQMLSKVKQIPIPHSPSLPRKPPLLPTICNLTLVSIPSDVWIHPSNFIGLEFLFLNQNEPIVINAPVGWRSPNSLRGSKVSPKLKTTKAQGVGAHSLWRVPKLLIRLKMSLSWLNSGIVRSSRNAPSSQH